MHASPASATRQRVLPALQRRSQIIVTRQIEFAGVGLAAMIAGVALGGVVGAYIANAGLPVAAGCSAASLPELQLSRSVSDTVVFSHLL